MTKEQAKALLLKANSGEVLTPLEKSLLKQALTILLKWELPQ